MKNINTIFITCLLFAVITSRGMEENYSAYPEFLPDNPDYLLLDLEQYDTFPALPAFPALLAEQPCTAEQLVLGKHQRDSEGLPSQKQQVRCEARSAVYQKGINPLVLENPLYADENPYACDECFYRGRTSGELERHMYMHISEKPYACNQCSYEGRTPRDLSSHMRIHTSEKSSVKGLYVCDQCDKKYKGLNCLRRHRNNKHQQHAGQLPLPRAQVYDVSRLHLPMLQGGVLFADDTSI